MRYVDFDGEELDEFPEVKERVVSGELQPGVIMIGSELFPIWDVPYPRMTQEFERMGARRASEAV